MGTKGEKTRQKILDDVAELFRTKGFGATSIKELVEATGVTKGSLYFHFPGKNDLSLEYLRQEGKRFMTFIEAGLEGNTAVERIDHFLYKALAYHRVTGFVGGCLFGNTALETSDTSPAFAELTADIFTQWKKKLAAVIAQAQADGSIHREHNAEDVAEFIIAVLEGGIMQSRLHKTERPMKNCIRTLRLMLYTNNPSSEPDPSHEEAGESHEPYQHH